MNGPTPTMSIMFSAIALRRLIPRTSPPLLACWLMSRAQQVHVKAHRARHPVRQLPEERIAGIDVSSFAELCAQHSTLQRLLTRVVGSKQWLIVFIPRRHEVDATLLHPSVEIFRSNGIRVVKNRIIRRKDRDRCLFHAH